MRAFIAVAAVVAALAGAGTASAAPVPNGHNCAGFIAQITSAQDVVAQALQGIRGEVQRGFANCGNTGRP